MKCRENWIEQKEIIIFKNRERNRMKVVVEVEAVVGEVGTFIIRPFYYNTYICVGRGINNNLCCFERKLFPFVLRAKK